MIHFNHVNLLYKHNERMIPALSGVSAIGSVQFEPGHCATLPTLLAVDSSVYDPCRGSLQVGDRAADNDRFLTNVYIHLLTGLNFPHR